MSTYGHAIRAASDRRSRDFYFLHAGLIPGDPASSEVSAREACVAGNPRDREARAEGRSLPDAKTVPIIDSIELLQRSSRKHLRARYRTYVRRIPRIDSCRPFNGGTSSGTKPIGETSIDGGDRDKNPGKLAVPCSSNSLGPSHWIDLVSYRRSNSLAESFDFRSGTRSPVGNDEITVQISDQRNRMISVFVPIETKAPIQSNFHGSRRTGGNREVQRQKADTAMNLPATF